MRLPAVIRLWPLASWLLALHTALVLLVYFLSLAPARGGDRYGLWFFLGMFDFPVSFLFPDLPSDALTALTWILVGGLQWSLVGLILDLVRKSVLRRAALRGTRNI
jgi:hypothetical protein